MTGSRYVAGETEAALKPYGAETVSVSVVESRLLWTEKIRDALDHLGDYQWLVFTSGNGVDLFFELLRQQDIDLRRLMHAKFAVVGKRRPRP